MQLTFASLLPLLFLLPATSATYPPKANLPNPSSTPSHTLQLLTTASSLRPNPSQPLYGPGNATQQLPHPTQPGWSTNTASASASGPSIYPPSSQNTTYHSPTLSSSGVSQRATDTPTTATISVPTFVQSPTPTGPREALFTDAGVRDVNVHLWKMSMGLGAVLGVMIGL
ncbi:hypothetical protein BS50DRAFT_571625 [Corynespora cassiicola Philippines]|uniref:Uncharacterized protein n=1 Tax=Corynespora cassiicola Philippines TaxID=1448308 RepID=A0A2T2NY72_CORCC|nr:hypothetical protein BS50DRAFT_571625 [Corynespora cassiicola Philippines]